MSLQCLAFYSSNGSGLYVACNDTAALRKAFAFFGDSREKIGFELTHLPEQGILEKPGGSGRADRPASWSLPYEVILGTFQGDWIAAAETYRSWATNQAWARESRLRRGEVPSWILNTGMWVWNRGRSENVLPPAVSLSQELHLPVNVCWHWWHGCAYDTGFPEYLPPREGVEPFKAALSAAQAKGVHALAYMNQRLWGMNTKSWHDEGAARFAVKGPDREIHPEIYNSFTKAPCASMCLGTQFWRRKYSSLAEQAVRDLGLDGIYMDQACASLSCYDPTHGHPLSGGSYWMDGFRSLAGEIRAAVPAVALAGEGCGEPWLPYLDLMLCLQVSKERYSAPDGSLFPSSLPSITNVR
jgi:hypothetical protein